jgi:hypothetical protein
MQGLGGFIVLVLFIVPFLKWAFPSNKKAKASRKLRREIARDLKRLKSK